MQPLGVLDALLVRLLCCNMIRVMLSLVLPLQVKPTLAAELAASRSMAANAAARKQITQTHRRDSGRMTRKSSRLLCQLLSLYSHCAAASVCQYFEMGMRQVKKARLHARMFGPGVAVDITASETNYSWHIPAGKPSDFFTFMSNRNLETKYSWHILACQAVV